MDWETIYQRKVNAHEKYILDTFHRSFTSSDRVFIFPEIPPSIKAGACGSYLILKPDELLIAIFDETFLKRNAECGFAFTTKRIYWRNSFSKPQEIEYSELADAIMFTRSGRTMLDLAEGAYLVIKWSLDNKRKDVIVIFLREIKTASMKIIPKKTMPMSLWHIAVEGKQYGPYDIETIKSMLLSSQIDHLKAHVWQEGMANWEAFMEVKELVALVQPSRKEVTSPATSSTIPIPPMQTEKITNTDKSQIDLNHVTLDELLTLPGFTLINAKKFIEERNRRRGFKSFEDIGIFLNIQPHQVERLKENAILTPHQSSDVTLVKGRVVDF